MSKIEHRFKEFCLSLKMEKYVTADTYKSKNVLFKDVVRKTKPVSYHRIPIKYMYGKEEGPLLIKTHKMFSFGLMENRDLATDKIQGYSMPFVTYDMNTGMTEEDKKFISVLGSINKLCRTHIMKKTCLI